MGHRRQVGRRVCSCRSRSSPDPTRIEPSQTTLSYTHSARVEKGSGLVNYINALQKIASTGGGLFRPFRTAQGKGYGNPNPCIPHGHRADHVRPEARHAVPSAKAYTATMSIGLIPPLLSWLGRFAPPAELRAPIPWCHILLWPGLPKPRHIDCRPDLLRPLPVGQED